MKRMLSFLMVFVFAICGCTKKTKEIKPIMPTELLSISQATAVLGQTYELKLAHDAVVDLGNNTYEAVYLSDPIGKEDGVYIDVTHSNDTLTPSMVRDKFKDDIDKRKNKKRIEGIGDEAYVAFPSLYVYQSGYYYKITAGSGNTEEQLNTLLELGKAANSNLSTYLENNK